MSGDGWEILVSDVRAAPRVPAPATDWQGYAKDLRDLCGRVLTEADEQTAAAFWELLVEVAALNARRIPGGRGWR